MRFSLRALVCTVVISCGALTSLQLSARELNSNPDRAPRTQGIEPDALTRIQLTAIVNHHAASAGLPVDFVSAVIRIESDWDVNLTGHAGEVGLMQIKPSTAREMGYTGSTLNMWIRRWVDRFHDQPYCLMAPQSALR